MTATVHISRDALFEEDAKWDWSNHSEGISTLTFNPGLSVESIDEGSSHPQDDRDEDHEETSVGEATPQSEPEPRRYKSLSQLYSETDPVQAEEEDCLLISEEPSSYAEAAREEVWKRAMKDEMEAIDRNHTWELVVPPPNCKPIGLKWLFKVKKSAKGEILRYKARLVVKGYSQRHGIDFDEVFAPVVRFEYIRVLIAVAAQEGWTLHHLDVKSAFLNGEVEEELYVKQPEGFLIEGREEWVLRLKKALYGLKQAPRAWYFKLHKCLLSLGFTKSRHEQTVYLKFSSDHKLIVGVYVDDLIVTGTRSEDVKTFKARMAEKFEMSDLGSLSLYLGIEVYQRSDGIYLSQAGYARHILESQGLQDCHSVQTPLEGRIKLSKAGGDALTNSTNFRSIVGSLRYLTHTRPDLLYSVGILNRYMEHPTSDHLAAAKRVLRYVKGTLDFGLRYPKYDSHDAIFGYSDSDFSGDMDDRKSTSGYVFFLGSSILCWGFVKQKTVALSSCEAEYIAATTATCQGIWLNRLVSELRGEEEKAWKLFIDNQSAIILSKNPVHHSRTKHIDTRYHFIRQCVEEKRTVVAYVKSEDQLADILTKSLGRLKFLEMRKRLGVQNTEAEKLEQGGE